MTDEFYNLILSLEYASKETQLEVINSFCSKWKINQENNQQNKIIISLNF